MTAEDEAALVDEVFAHAAEFDAMTPAERVQEYRRREQEDPEAARLWALFHAMRGMRFDEAAAFAARNRAAQDYQEDRARWSAIADLLETSAQDATVRTLARVG